MISSRLALWSCVLLGGCAAASFTPQFKPPEASAPTVAVDALAHPKLRDERPVLVGVTQEPQRLFAWDLSAGLLWERPIDAKCAPLVVGDAIVLQEAEGVVVRDLASGEVRVVVDVLGKLVGADGDGRTLVVSMAYETTNPRGAVAIVDGDSVRWKQPLNLPVGVPALSGAYVMVPWATQRLSVLDVRDGRELGRYHFKSTVMGHAVVDRGQLYVGQLGLVPVNAQLLAHPEDKFVPFTPLKRSLPSQPPLLRDGYVPVPDPDNALHRLSLDWRVTTTDTGLHTENDLLMLRFYRLLFALDANKDELRWVRTFDHDLVGIAIVAGGMFVADGEGALSYLDAAGTTRFSRSVGRVLRVATLRPGAWTPSEAATVPASAAVPVAGTQPSAAGTPVQEAPHPSLNEQLFAAAALPDDRLSAGRAYSVELLGASNDIMVTSHLIELCSNRKSPQPVQTAACNQLAKRESGEADIAQALRQRASFLEGTEAPPVGALAQAAAKMQLKQVGPLLVTHVEDPNTPVRDLVAVFEAIEKLGQRSAAGTLERFVRLHHDEPEGSELTPAIFAAMHALGALNARAQRPSLQAVAEDGLATEGMREHARAALAMLDARPVKADAPVKAEASAEEETSDEIHADPRPYSLTVEVLRKVMQPVRASLSQCLVSDATRPRAGRFSIVVNATGSVEGIFVTPTTLAPCVEPLLRAMKFPTTRIGRQRVTQVFHGPNALKTFKPPQPAKAGKPAKPRAAGARRAAAPAPTKP